MKVPEVFTITEGLRGPNKYGISRHEIGMIVCEDCKGQAVWLSLKDSKAGRWL